MIFKVPPIIVKYDTILLKAVKVLTSLSFSLIETLFGRNVSSRYIKQRNKYHLKENRAGFGPALEYEILWRGRDGLEIQCGQYLKVKWCLRLNSLLPVYSSMNSTSKGQREAKNLSRPFLCFGQIQILFYWHAEDAGDLLQTTDQVTSIYYILLLSRSTILLTRFTSFYTGREGCGWLIA